MQRCDLKFGSWTYGGWSLDLQMIEADVSGYIANGEWDLVGKSAEERCNSDEFCVGNVKIFCVSTSES